jgi:hypothetical protein
MSRLRILALASVSLFGFAVLALVAQSNAPTAAKMTDAAQKFVATLSPEEKTKALYPFDAQQRTMWWFTPQQDKQKQSTRKGLRLDQMSAEQRKAAYELLKTGLSDNGYKQATTIISLEALLKELEGDKGAMTRNPEWYFVSIFGEPSNTGPWTWRFEGHHLSVNVTLDKGQVVDATPVLFGANPAIVKGGPRAGLQTLPEIEDAARALITSLSEEQNKVAKQDKPFAEIREGFAEANVGAPVGIAAAKLNDSQKATLNKLLDAYANRMPPDVAAAEKKRATDAGIEHITFAYSGSAVVGEGYTYRVYGPTFVIEFLNMQADSAKNPANHIHSTWRRLPADFALKQ